MDLRIGVIGCGGFAGYAHGPALAALASRDRGITLAACCDLDGARASEYSQDFGFAHAYTDLDEMLDQESLDAALVLVAPRHTASVVARVIPRRVPVLLEKPPGLTLGELDHLIQLADEHGVPMQVAFNRRYMPLLREARAILDGDFPPIMEIHYELIRFDRRDPDFSTTAIHAIDAVRFLAGRPFQVATIRFGDSGEGIGSADATIFIEGEDGLSAIIQIQPRAGLVSEGFKLHGVGASLVGQIVGPGGAHSSGRLEYWRDDALKYSYQDDQLPFVEKHGIYGELAAFCEAVTAGVQPSPTLAECRQQVALMQALREQVSRPLDLRDLAESLCSA